MGVPDLWEIVLPSRKGASLEALAYAHFFRTGRFFKVGVDISIWFAKQQTGLKSKHIGSHAQLGQNPELRNIFLRVSRLSALPIILLAVFDGPNRPSKKRKAAVSSSPHWMTARTKEIFTAFGHYYHMAPGEAEAELSYLNQAGCIDAVLTDDSDALVFGAQFVIRNPHDKKHPDSVFTYDARDFGSQPETPILPDGMLLFAILRGGDYHSGLHNCGKVTAYDLTNTTLGTILRFAAEDYTRTKLRHFLDENWVPDLKCQLTFNSDSFLKKRQPKVASCIPSNFPDVQTVYHYVRPVITTSVTTAPVVSLPDFADVVNVPLLGSLCDRLFSWGIDNIMTKKLEKTVWPSVCVRKLLKGHVKDVVSLNSIKSITSELNVLICTEFDISRLPLLAVSLLPGVDATNADTKLTLWLPAAIFDADSLLVEELQNKYRQQKQTAPVKAKIQLLDRAFKIFSSASLPDTPTTSIRSDPASLASPSAITVDVSGFEYARASAGVGPNDNIIDLTLED
ncbi:PIN domain-like protein [Dendrothele bispora CBS 962.96]|uniref:PIN domain-like protein n=1 Tax=Dendrothele bispora (strain CBS 962.96) TaxID=1314807 RepID=A0A4S8L1P3_DENBC|nr:PIN domain-like protein [Dendrothele bispora CBS 962.96]